MQIFFMYSSSGLRFSGPIYCLGVFQPSRFLLNQFNTKRLLNEVLNLPIEHLFSILLSERIRNFLSHDCLIPEMDSAIITKCTAKTKESIEIIKAPTASRSLLDISTSENSEIIIIDSSRMISVWALLTYISYQYEALK
jgi:hypothetical protein